MFDYRQRETTNEYRDGWDLIWGERKMDEQGKMDEQIIEYSDANKTYLLKIDKKLKQAHLVIYEYKIDAKAEHAMFEDIAGCLYDNLRG